MVDLSGKRVLITGGAGGVGRAVARLFSKREARLLLADRGEPELQQAREEIGGDIDIFAGDLSNRSDIERIFQRVDEKLGGLDILVACAGVGSGPLMEMDDEGWRNVLESNLASYLACTRGAIERMRAGGGEAGIIVLVGSISVHIKAIGESVYNAAKGGVASFAETLRKEMMEEGIRITLIEPGAIASAMQPFAPEERERMMRENRLLPPQEVAEAILFAVTRPPGVDVVTLRIEPLIQKIH